MPCRRQGREYSSYSFLTSALDGGEWSESCLSHTLPWKRTRDTHYIGDWVVLRAGLDTEAREKSLPLLGIEPWSSSL
jgi:hypothetical protein